jgi:hypothetical protein
MKTLTAENYKAQVEKNEKVKVEGLRNCKTMQVGQVVRQGDIYIHKVSDKHNHGEEIENHQLAFGLSQGSRHIADKSFKIFEGTTLPEYCNSSTFHGPCIKSDDANAMITHPEHGNICTGKGTFQITHQMDLRSLKRVID